MSKKNQMTLKNEAHHSQESDKFKKLNKENIKLSFKYKKIPNKDLCILYGYDPNELNEIQKFKKASRHLKDCIYKRNIVHFPENDKFSKFIKFSYYITSSNWWKKFLFFLAVILLILFVFESLYLNSNHNINTKKRVFNSILVFDIFILIIFSVDAVSTIYIYNNTRHYNEKNKTKFISNFLKTYFNVILKIIIIIIRLVDTLVFYFNFVNNIDGIYYLRFSEIFRLFFIIYYSDSIQENIICLLNTYSNFFDLLFFYVFIILIFVALSSILLTADTCNKNFNKYLNYFNDYYVIFNSFFALFTFDNYPKIFLPFIGTSYLPLLIFFIYILINIMYILYLPTAVLFEKFRIRRSWINLKKSIIEKEAIFNCFLILTLNKEDKVISLKELHILNQYFLGKNFNFENSKKIFYILNVNQNNKLCYEEFMNYIELYYNEPFLFFIEINFKYWNIVRNFLNKNLKISYIIEHKIFNIIVYLVIIFNTILIIISFFNKDNKIFEKIDEYLVFFYLFENILKIIGQGFQIYFSYTWNITYFSLISFSVIFFFINNVFNFQFGINIVIDLFKRLIVLAKLVKNIKILNKIKYLKTSVNQSINVFVKILICLKSVFNTFIILIIIIYIYSIIAMKIFNFNEIKNDKDYQILIPIADSLIKQIAQLLFMIAENGWSTRIIICAEVTDAFVKCSIFYNSYYFIVRIILINLLIGQIWEFFNIIDIDVFIDNTKIVKKTVKNVDNNKNNKKSIFRKNINNRKKTNIIKASNLNNNTIKDQLIVNDNSFLNLDKELNSLKSKVLTSSIKKNFNIKNKAILNKKKNYIEEDNNNIKEEEEFEMIFSPNKIDNIYFLDQNKKGKFNLKRFQNYSKKNSKSEKKKKIRFNLSTKQEICSKKELDENSRIKKKIRKKNNSNFVKKQWKFIQVSKKSKSQIIEEEVDNIVNMNPPNIKSIEIFINNKKNVYDYFNKYDYNTLYGNIYESYIIDYLNFNINYDLFGKNVKNEFKSFNNFNKNLYNKLERKSNINKFYNEDDEEEEEGKNNILSKLKNNPGSNKSIKINKPNNLIEENKNKDNILKNSSKIEIGKDIIFFLNRSFNLLEYENFSIFNLLGNIENLINDNFCKNGFFKFIFVLKNSYISVLNSSYNNNLVAEGLNIKELISKIIQIKLKDNEIYFLENINSKLLENKLDKINIEKDIIELSKYSSNSKMLEQRDFDLMNFLILIKANMSFNFSSNKIKEIYFLSFQCNTMLNNKNNAYLANKRNNEDDFVKNCIFNIKKDFRLDCCELGLLLQKISYIITQNAEIFHKKY